MTGQELQVLAVVKEKGEAGGASIARKMAVSKGYVGRILAALAEDGYLEDVGDGNYSVTEEGRLVLEPYKGRFTGRVPVSNYP